MLRTSSLMCLAALAVCALPQAAHAKKQHPDLTGIYDIATLTPLRRPEKYGDKLYLSDEEAKAIEEAEAREMEETSRASDPNRGAPPSGGDGSEGAAGNVGGYNSFWIDRGTRAASVEGKFRTSIIHSPANGRTPELTPNGRMRYAELYGRFRKNEGKAWWLPGPGPYDNPEDLTLSDRCLLGFSSTSGPPMLPALYNNLHQIVQTEDHVMILTEMIHDARIVRLNSEHLPSDVRKWLGDSIGWWEGDTLVVETTNFTDAPALGGASEHLKVTERFRRVDDTTLLYSFTVEDPTVWVEAWSGEYSWPETDDRMFEYACHEGNYAMTSMLRGARLLEEEAMAENGSAAGAGNE